MKAMRTVLLCLVLAACSGSGDDGDPCAGDADPGELLITEFMVDPAGDDADLEWLELYNASARPQCLNGLFLEAAGATIEQHLIQAADDLIIMPGSFMLLGGSAVADVAYSWPGGFNLPNTSATLYLKRGGVALDAVAYGAQSGRTVKEGHSNALCGECNDLSCSQDSEHWFRSDGAAYDAVGNKGTPGQPNGDCTCATPSGATALRSPKPGDLLITEIYANPPGDDGDAEWFEVRVVAQDAAIDFANVGLVREAGGNPVATVNPFSCLLGLPEDHIVFGRSQEMTANGGLTVDYAYGSSLTLANGGGYVGLVYKGELIAGSTYPEQPEGPAWQYDGTSKEWCAATMPFGESGGFGTPGYANPECGIATCILQGTPVNSQLPIPGEIEISEIFPNTPGKEMPDREWFEVRVTGSREIDFNGLEIWDADPDTGPVDVIQAADGRCLRVQPGGHVLFARSDVEMLNGLNAGSILDLYETMNMTTEDGYLGLHYHGAVIDSATWEKAEDGRALQKDPSTGDWCDATYDYWTTPENQMAFGTPGAPNDNCAGGGTCLSGGEPRQITSPDLGELVINEVFANPDGNDSTKHEWVEVYATAAAVGKDLNGIELFVQGESAGIIGEGSEKCVTIESQYAVIGHTADKDENGGVGVDIVLPSLGLNNSDVAISLARGATTYDFVYITETTDGAARQLDPDFQNANANDSPDNWCDAKTAFNEVPELGTPGEENPSCSAEFCNDGAVATQLKKFYPGDLVITEVYANPDGADGKKEWFEVYVRPEAEAAHLNGIGIMKSVGEEPEYIFTTAQCILLEPGQHYVLCRSADPEENGGLEDCIEYGSVTLVNSGGVIGLGKPGVLYDLVPAYGDAKDGVSRSLDPDAYTETDNDSGDNWCDTPAEYTFSDGRGTPGGTNPPCPD